MLEFQSPALNIGKNTCFANEWQWFYDSAMSKGRVIGTFVHGLLNIAISEFFIRAVVRATG